MSNTMGIITWSARNMCVIQDDYDIKFIAMGDTPLSLPENKETILSYIGKKFKNRWMEEDLYEFINSNIQNEKGILLENEDWSFSEYLDFEEYKKYFVVED